MLRDADACPFPGPRPFTTAERKQFFGRAGETRDLVSLVIAHPLAVLHGPTGSGKTSLIHAGLVPELEAAGFEVLPVARIGGLLPPGTDAGRLRNVFTYSALLHWARADEQDVDLLSGYTLAGYLKRLLEQSTSKQPLAIVFDQVEDMFTTYPEQWQHREGFLRELAEVLQGDRGFGLAGRPLRVLLAIRDDRLGDLERHAHVVPDTLRVRYALDDLRLAEAIEAIHEPARGRISQTDAEQLGRALAHRRVRLPAGKLALIATETVDPMHLQVACDEMWQRGGHGNAKDLDPDEALTRFVGAAVRRAAVGWSAERKIRRWLGERMITPDGARATARRGATSTGGLANNLVENLELERLVRAEERLGNKWYELAHDRLIEPIRRSHAQWSEQQRRGRRAWRVVLWILVISALGVGVAYLVRLGLDRWEGFQGQQQDLESKIAAHGEDKDRLTRQRGLAWGELEGTFRQVLVERHDAEVQALGRDVLALQAVVADMGRYRSAAQDLATESETLLNFASAGVSLAGVTSRVQAAVVQNDALRDDISKTRKANPSPELKEMFDKLRDAINEIEPEFERMQRALGNASSKFATANARLSAELETFEGKPGNTPAARVREGSQGHWRAGYRAWLAGDLATAKGRFARAVERDDTNPAAHDGVARIAWAEGRVDDAAAEYRKAISARREFGPALTGLAEVYLHQHKQADAERCARQALHFQPDYAAAFLVLSEVRRRITATEPLGEVSGDNPCGASMHAATPSAPATPNLTPPPASPPVETPPVTPPVETPPVETPPVTTPPVKPPPVEPPPVEPPPVKPPPEETKKETKIPSETKTPVEAKTETKKKPPKPKPPKKKPPEEDTPVAPVDRAPPPIEINPP